MKRFFLAFALLGLPIYAFADGGLPNQPYIYVEGTGKIERDPNKVTLQFTLGAQDLDQDAANKKVQAQAAKVFALLNGKKIAEKDVEAVSLRAEAEYAENPASPLKHGDFKGYSVKRRFSVTVREVSAFPQIVDELLALGIEEFSDISTGLFNEEELRDQVSEKALANARERAEKMLKGEKMKIDSVYAVSEIPFPLIGYEFFGANEDARRGISIKDKLDPMKYRLAPITVSQSVHVIYLISPTK